MNITLKQSTTSADQPKNRLRKTWAPIIAFSTLTLLAAPTYAGVIDQVKTKVDAIKNDTATLKTRTSDISNKADELIDRAAETASTVNAVIAETDIIKQALAPIDSVQALKERFAELQFEPLELIQGEEFEYAIEQIKRRRQAAQERLNDPDVENFRYDFLTLLEQLRYVAMPDIGPEVTIPASPLETVLAEAPRPVVAIMKQATEQVLEPLMSSVSDLAESQAALKALGVVGNFESDDVRCNVYALNAERIYRKALRATKRVTAIKHSLSLIEIFIPEDDDEIEVKIWGWAGVQADITEPLSTAVEILKLRMEVLSDRYDLDRELAEHYSTAQGCAESAYGTYDNRLSDYLDDRGY